MILGIVLAVSLVLAVSIAIVWCSIGCVVTATRDLCLARQEPSMTQAVVSLPDGLPPKRSRPVR